MKIGNHVVTSYKKRGLSENKPSGLIGKLIGTAGGEVLHIETDVNFTPEAKKTLYTSIAGIGAAAIIVSLILKS